jgi:hypothetical protein
MCPAAGDKILKKKLNLLTGTRGLEGEGEEEEEEEELGIDCVCWSCRLIISPAGRYPYIKLIMWRASHCLDYNLAS